MRRVFVLGAGASKALNDKAPLMAELLPSALKFANEDRNSVSVGSARNVKEFIQQFYGVNGETNLPPFEDMLSQLDFCITSNLPLSGPYRVEKLRKLRNDLIYIMGRVIQVALDGEVERDLSYKFLNQLDRDYDAIISLNYDLIIDNAALQDESPIRLNYQLPSRNMQHQQTLFNSDMSLPLYKLHGSLNWLYCPVCREMETTDARKVAIEAITKPIHCDICKSILEPMLITPSFLKDYNNSFIVQLWREAQNKLHDTDEVIFVGYAMPDADIVLRMFFTRALYTNYLRNKRRCKVTVVNQVNPAQPESEPTTKQRYEQLFGEIDYHATGFGSYIENGCRVEMTHKNNKLDS